jgi:acylphosphatase
MAEESAGTGRLGRRFVVSGRVQGVGFRYFVLRRAQALGLVGWTRNLEDGRVEVRAWGTGAELDELGIHLRTGPRSASVTNVDTSEISDAADQGSSFRVIG